MDALEQIVEREGSVDRNHDFAIDHESSRTDLAHDLDDVGEIARERLSRLRNEIDAISITKHEAAESIPFRLVLPLTSRRKLVDEKRLHGRVRAGQREGHNSFRRSNRPRVSLSGLQRSPMPLTRAGTLSMRKSSIASPFSISFHETGVDTGARGLGRGEYTDASVLPHAFWL